MYETAYLVSWLRDKAARADDQSFQRMLSAAAQRLEDLSKAQCWTPVAEGLPVMRHEVYDDVDGPLEYDISDPVLVVTVSGDLIVARLTRDEGGLCWFDPEAGDVLDVDRWLPVPRKSVEVQ